MCVRTNLLLSPAEVQTTQLPACPPLTCLDLNHHLLLLIYLPPQAWLDHSPLSRILPLCSQTCLKQLHQESRSSLLPTGLVVYLINRTSSQPTLKPLDLSAGAALTCLHPIIHIHIYSLYAVWYEN